MGLDALANNSLSCDTHTLVHSKAHFRQCHFHWPALLASGSTEISPIAGYPGIPHYVPVRGEGRVVWGKDNQRWGGNLYHASFLPASGINFGRKEGYCGIKKSVPAFRDAWLRPWLCPSTTKA